MEITRSNGIEPFTYVERSWDGSKVVSTARVICDYTELSGSDKEGFRRLESGKWYVVKTSFECKSIYAPKGRPAHLIICDGSTLTARIDIDKDNALHIYGQQNDSGKLIAKGFTWISQKDDDGVIQDVTNLPGIGSRLNMGKLVIHGGNISASCSEATHSAGIGSGEQNDGSKWGGLLTVYGGNIEAIGGNHGAGIGGGQDASGGRMVFYGGTVKAQGGEDAAGIGTGERCTEKKLKGYKRNKSSRKPLQPPPLGEAFC
ncbi:MAG: hypothetical protein IJP46_03755 [Prevotella sp.]|nr:hypothetical protein [Prevotella sp.]